MRAPILLRNAFVLALIGTLLGATGTPAASQTLKAVKDRGALSCGVSMGVLGFSMPAAGGEWRGFDVDFCRALAAAIFNDAGRV